MKKEVVPKTKNDTLRIRLEDDLKSDLQELADKAQRKLSDYIRLELKKIADKAKHQ